MPYKDKEKQKEAVRIAVSRGRVLQKGITEQGITASKGMGITPGTVGTTYTSYFKDGGEMVPADGILPERTRYLKLSDGQVLDRANQPMADISKLSGVTIQALRNLGTGFIPSAKDKEKTLKELKNAIK